MPLSEGSLFAVRNWIGTETPPTDEDLHAMYDGPSGQSPKAVVEGTLRRRLAEFLTDAAQFAAGGVVTIGTQANIVGLQKELENLSLMPDNLGWDDETGEYVPYGTIGVQQMKRVGYRR